MVAINFAYSAVLLLPVALVAGFVYLTKTLTGDASKGLPTMPTSPHSVPVWWSDFTNSVVPTCIGVGMVAVGFALVAITWGEIVGRSSVALQLPYLVSGGITSLGLMMSGLLVTNLAAKRRDAGERDRQLIEVAEALRELRRSVQDDQ